MKQLLEDKRKAIAWASLLFSLLVFRTIYGLFSEFWFADELQVYLLGLKYFTTGLWPYFGPDVVYSKSQIPGALQGLLVGVPFFVCPLPEAPAIFLNLLSFSSLASLAWYLTRRFAELPRWFIWIWTLTCPWAMVYSTRVVNPSYMLPFAIFFFLAIFEIYPIYREKIIPERIAFFFVGLSIAAVMQLHMSWVLMIPMALAGFFFQYRRDRGRLFAVAAYCLLGALIGFSTLIPTFIVHGIGGTGGVERNVVINSAHLADIVLILPRFLFFAAFQIHYMIPGGSWADLMRDHRWLLPFAALLEGVGWMQVAFFFICLFLPDRSPEWNRTRWFTILAVAMIHVSFLFSIKEPSSHTMYLMFPLALFYSCHCYRRLMFGHIWRRRIIAGILVVGIIFHVGLAIDNYENRSLYKRRDLVENALTQKDYKLLGLRRADEWGHGY